MLFYYCVFTLGDTANRYLDMFCLSYKSLKRQSVIKPDDTVLLLCDPITAKKADQIQFLKTVQKVIVPKPETVFEGSFLRYKIHKFYNLQYGQDCVYLDCDMLCIRPFNITCNDGTILVYPEGSPHDSNYRGDGRLAMPFGISSTFFAFKFSKTIETLFQSVCSDTGKIYYTLDQPYFNRAVNVWFFQKAVMFMSHDTISYNANKNMDTAVFVNLCGEPGNAEFHWTKMLDFSLLL